MTNQKWDMKLDYMLTLAVCKYGLEPERWDLVAEDLAEYITTTSQACKAQFQLLCQQYTQDWHNEGTGESLHTYICSVIKRHYYGDLCERMTESRDLLLVVYDFISLFKCGRVKLNDINDLLQDVKNSRTTANSSHGNNDREQKLKMLARLKSHMSKQTSKLPDREKSSSLVELIPPPPFFQYEPVAKSDISLEQPIVTKSENDRQVPSLTNDSLPTITQPIQSSIINDDNQSNEVEIDEIELISNEDEDNDRIETVETSNIDETITDTNVAMEQEDSTSMSVEQTETNESSTMAPVPIEISNDKDLEENADSNGMSSQSASDSRLSIEEVSSSNMSGPPTSSNLRQNMNVGTSADFSKMEMDRAQSAQSQDLDLDSVQQESTSATMSRMSVDDTTDVNSMDIAQPVSTDPTVITTPNDSTSLFVDEPVSTTAKLNENDEPATPKSANRKSRSSINTKSQNYRKSVLSVINNLKTAKYGYDFAKPLKSFKLPENYHYRVKKPLDIPEIRERINNGDYDNNILLFERDIFLMFTNALSMYNRDLDIHGHAKYMLNYAMELFTAIDDTRTPWKTGVDPSTANHPDNENDSDDNILNTLSNIRTPSKVIPPPSSENSTDSSIKSLRRSTSSNHPMSKRQRKTIQ